MSRMKNYRDLSKTGSDVSAGFQFEFFCQGCDFTWRSNFKPHRMGQLTGWISRLTFLMSDLGKAGRATGALSDSGSRGAHDEAFLAAQTQAQRYFNACPGCQQQMCDSCLDDSQGSCKSCLKQRRGAPQAGGYAEDGGDGGYDAAPRCANCQVPSTGGRFCHECGFDMASTHKGCPGCGSVMPRAARFCTDCGHGF
ncbi:MAG: zinc ribbon domain-containing protein [Rubrivivax sp.]|nr:MAG: zinc ribbon domain-containing protein [Rubrivivax sp.]